MSRSIRFRLSLSHLLVIAIGMTLTGALIWLGVEQAYLSTQRDNLLAQAQLTAAALGNSPLPDTSPELYTQTTNISPGIHTRLLDQAGAVILGVPFPAGENPLPVPPDEDPGFVAADQLLQRPEIQSALNGQAETAIRRIEALDQRRVLYAAAPVLDEEGQVINLVYLATPLPTRGLPPDLSTLVLGVVLGSMILAGLVGLYLAGRISKPLEVLDQAASAVSQGKLNQQVPITKGILELENLSTRFNQMTRDLHHSEQAKSAFIADVTHELQTPLTVIKGTVETLEDGALDDLDGRGDLLAAMSRETDRMINLVNDLLILTKAEVSALRYEVKPFHLKSLIEDRIQLLKQLAGNKEVSFQLESRNLDTNQDYVVQGDKNRTAQVLDNILDNALRHSPEKSPITITLDRRSNRIICEVKDQGPGIPSQHLPYIFERFYRVDSARDRRRGGSGLGLAIAKSLIEGQQGKIKAVSSPGDGTTIIFELPAYSSLS